MKNICAKRCATGRQAASRGRRLQRRVEDAEWQAKRRAHQEAAQA